MQQQQIVSNFQLGENLQIIQIASFDGASRGGSNSLVEVYFALDVIDEAQMSA
jgi:hypothetical protein